MLKKLFKFGGSSDFGTVPNAVITIVGLSVIILAWHMISAYEIVPTKILPDPFKVIGSIPSLISEYSLFANIWYTVKLNLSCYFYAILIAFPIGFLMSLYPINNILLGKYSNALRYLPMPAITGIFIAIFGLTFGMKTSFLTVCILIYIIPTIVNKVNDLQNPSNVKDNVYLQTIKTLGANNWQKFRYVYLPYVTSGVANDIVNLSAVSYSYVVICEMIYKDGTISGIGALINTMVRQSYMAEAFALLFIIIIIGCLQDFLFTQLAKKLFLINITIKNTLNNGNV